MTGKINFERLHVAKEKESPINTRIAVSVFFFVSGFIFASWASRIPYLQLQFHLSNAQLGSILFILPLGLMITMPLAAWLLNKYESRYILFGSSLFYCALLFALSFVNQMWQLSIILFLFGGARNLFNISVNTQAVCAQAIFRKSIITTFHGIWSLAGFVGLAFASFILAREISIQQHFMLASFFASFLIVVSFQYLVRNDIGMENKKLVFRLPEKSLVTLSIIAFSCMFCEGIMSEWTGVHFVEELKVQKWLVTSGYSSYLVAMTSCRFAGDFVVNRLGTKRVLEISGILVAAGSLILMFLPYLFYATIGCFLVGMGLSCIMPLVIKLTAKTHVTSTGTAIASVSTVAYLGILVGPTIMGYFSTLTGLRWAFVLVCLFGTLISALVYKTKIYK